MEPQKYFFVKTNDSFVKVLFKEISYIKASGDHLLIHTTSSRYMVDTTLNSLEEKLSDYGFFRVHRSYLINLDNVLRVASDTVQVIGDVIPIAKGVKKKLLKKLNVITSKYENKKEKVKKENCG